MGELSIDMTYAAALFEAAEEEALQLQIREEAESLLAVFRGEPELYRYFCMPGIPADEKKKVLANTLDGRISRELLNFLYVLVDKGRFRHYERMVKAYGVIEDEAHGLTAGEVYSAAPLTEKQIAALEEQTGKLIGENVHLTNHIDKSLIGGVKVMAAGKIFDASLKQRLEDMRRRME